MSRNGENRGRSMSHPTQPMNLNESTLTDQNRAIFHSKFNETFRKRIKAPEPLNLALEGPGHCFICMRSGTMKKPLIEIPCKNNCRRNLVHTKCIYEWKERQKNKGNCPLCRGVLGYISYSPIDYLRSSSLSDYLSRKLFNLTPLSKKAGMVRCFLKVKNNPWWGSPFLYEFYLQKPSIKKYPLGPLPSSKSPQQGDIFLMAAKKRTQIHSFFSGLLGLNFTSLQNSIDISMEHDFDRNGKHYLGNVQASSFTGLEYTVNANVFDFSEDSAAQTSISSNKSSKSNKVHGVTADQSVESDSTTTSRGKSLKFFGRKKTKEVGLQSDGLFSTTSEVASVLYAQNRVGAESGPRKMMVAFPDVKKMSWNKGKRSILGRDFIPNEINEPSTTVSKEPKPKKEPQMEGSSEYDEFSSDESSDEEWENEVFERPMTNFFQNETKESYTKVLRRRKTASTNPSSTCSASRTNEEGLLFGKNKEPRWLERAQAYSLDFNGRVILPSNKNFQIMLENDSETLPLLNGRENEDIVLQFGKVVGADDCQENVGIYTIDFRYPLSPFQALGVCLSSCDRKFACA